MGAMLQLTSLPEHDEPRVLWNRRCGADFYRPCLGNRKTLWRPLLAGSGFSHSGLTELKTTKCDIEKFMAKLATIAKSLAARTGRNIFATSRTAVPTTRPATPAPMKPAYVRSATLRPDSAAKVVKQFIKYEPEMARNQATKFASRGDNPKNIQAIEKTPKSTKVFIMPTRPKLIAFNFTDPFGQASE